MEEKLDFSLPEKKNKNSSSAILVLLILIVLIVSAANLYFISQKNKPAAVNLSTFSSEQTKELANKLAQRGLNQQAAKVWQDYLNSANLPEVERAKALFQIGTQLEKANLYSDAIEYFYRSEMAAKVDELESQINSHIQQCFENSGKFSALRYELMDRTGFKKTDSGGKILAEIGSEKISDSDLETIIENNIDSQLKPMAIYMSPEQLNNQKKEMLEQFKNNQSKMQFLQSWVAEEILYRQALQEQLADKPEVKGLIGQLQRKILSQQLINQQLASKIHITDSDLQTYYSANKDKFTEQKDPNDPNSPKLQKSFDDVKESVYSEILNKKRQEVQREYIKEMMDKYNVVIHTSAITTEEKTQK